MYVTLAHKLPYMLPETVSQVYLLIYIDLFMTVHIRYGTSVATLRSDFFTSLYESEKKESLSLDYYPIVFRTKPSRSHEFSPYLLYTNRR